MLAGALRWPATRQSPRQETRLPGAISVRRIGTAAACRAAAEIDWLPRARTILTGLRRCAFSWHRAGVGFMVCWAWYACAARRLMVEVPMAIR